MKDQPLGQHPSCSPTPSHTPPFPQPSLLLPSLPPLPQEPATEEDQEETGDGKGRARHWREMLSQVQLLPTLTHLN